MVSKLSNSNKTCKAQDYSARAYDGSQLPLRQYPRSLTEGLLNIYHISDSDAGYSATGVELFKIVRQKCQSVMQTPTGLGWMNDASRASWASRTHSSVCVESKAQWPRLTTIEDALRPPQTGLNVNPLHMHSSLLPSAPLWSL